MSLFISYNREQKDFADKIESTVRTVCPILRDTNDIAPWGSIEEFMNRIRQAEYAVLLISDEYLKSINCMYKACQLYKDVNWKARNMYVVFENANIYVYTVANHERYIRYWKDRKTKLEEQIKSLPTESIDSITAEIKRVSEILLMLGDFLKVIRDTNNVQPEDTIDAILYLASRYANNPALGIKVPAFSFGADTDTIASITGGLLGMLCGTNWIPTEWKVVQDYECLVRITELLLADNRKQASKADAAEANAQESDWVNTIIGRIRKVGTTTVPNGKYAIVTITKWQSALGQTFYMKDMQKLDYQPHRTEGQMQIPQQPTLYDVSSQAQPKAKSQPLAQVHETEPVKTIVALKKTQRRFVLDETSIADLLGNPQFKTNITIGKVLKIVRALIDGNKASAAIAKQFEVEQAIVDLIKIHVIE